MSILVGKHINAVLSCDAEVRRSLGSRIYPVAIPQSAPAYPFIVYTNTGTRPDYTKDGTLEDVAGVMIVLVHPDYTSGISLANRVRYLFEGVTAQYDDFEVCDCELAGTSEDYDADLEKYVFTLSLTLKTIDK